MKTINYGKRVFIYFNLHKKTFSIKSMSQPDYGKVIGHADNIVLTDCTFKVNEKGRQRVLAERKKNVHAGIIGHIVSVNELTFNLEHKVTYNPYKFDSFVYADNNSLKVHDADRVVISKQYGITI